MNKKRLREWITRLLLEATDREREEMERAVADYRDDGGKVTKVPRDPSLPDNHAEWIPGDLESRTPGRRADPEDRSKPDLGDCDTNPLYTGTMLGFAAEWAVFHAAQGAVQPSGAPWGDARITKKWKISDSACQRDFVNAYKEMYNLTVPELAKLSDHGDVTLPPAGKLPAGAQSNTAPVDVPLENINIHVKYNQGATDRLQGFQKEKSKKGVVSQHGSPSTEAYYEALRDFTAPYVKSGGTQELDALKDLNRLYPDVRVLDNYNNPTRPDALKGFAEITKARTRLRNMNTIDSNNPQGLLIRDKAIAKKIGIPAWDGESNPWWAEAEGMTGSSAFWSQVPKHQQSVVKKIVSDGNVSVSQPKRGKIFLVIAEFDELNSMFQRFLDERALMIKDPSTPAAGGTPPRSKFFAALEDKNYADLVLKDIYEQHFDLPLHTDDTGALSGARRDISLKPSYYAKFFSSPPSKPGSSPHSLKFTGGGTVDTIPILAVVPDISAGSTNFYRVVGLGPDDIFPLTGKAIKHADPDLAGKEALRIQFNFSGQTKVPQLLGGRDFAEFSKKIALPPNETPIGEDTVLPEGRQKQPVRLVAAYVREILNLLRS